MPPAESSSPPSAAPAAPPAVLRGPLAYSGIVSQLRSAGCVFAEEEARLLLAEASGPGQLADNVRRRVQGEPLEYILGWAEFAGLRIAVEPGVFVPRRRTELLVNEAVALLTADPVPPAPTVVDLCSGSGAVGAAILRRLPGVELHATDIDPAAVACARRNVALLGGRVHVGDLFRALPPGLHGQVQLLAVNAPYVPTDAIRTMPPEARLHEPAASLDGGPDGLDFHRRLAAEASEWLAPGGYLLIETSGRQAAATAAILAAAGFGVRTVRSEDLDGTAVVGTIKRAGR
ncbi:MAG TPA: putative protein N(5)-glutamine methyltransferase [Arthrobacter sp.]